MRIEAVEDLEAVIRWLDPRSIALFLEEWQDDRSRGGVVIAAYEGDTIIGYLDAEAKLTGSTYIKHVLVAADHRKKGVASALYDAIAPLTGASELVAQVPPEHTASVAFHEAYRRSIEPGSTAFKGGWWVCSAPQRF